MGDDRWGEDEHGAPVWPKLREATDAAQVARGRDTEGRPGALGHPIVADVSHKYRAGFPDNGRCWCGRPEDGHDDPPRLRYGRENEADE